MQKKLGNNVPEIIAILAQMKTDADDSVQHIRDTVWSINPDNDTLEKLIEKTHAFALQLLTSNDISVSFINEILPENMPKLSMEQRRNIYLIVKEAINNIAKHSDASKVSINISRTQYGIYWLIKDNGKGFDEKEVFEGNGLKNFKKRANEGDMNLTISSKIGEGTTLEVLIQLG